MDTQQEALQYALRCLSRKSYYSSELAAKLRSKHYPHDVIVAVLEKCESMGYVNDTEWMAANIRSHLSRNVGPRRIVQKLRLKGVPVDEIAPHMEEAASDDSQEEAIRKLLESKRYAQQQDKQKIIASLMRKGFDLDVILRIVK